MVVVHALIRALQLLALLLMLILLGLGSLLWSAVAWVLYPLLPRRLGLRVGRAAIAHGYRLFWWAAGVVRMMRLDTRVVDTVRQESGLIIVANHPSMVDAPLLVARLPRAACIMKASLMRNPFLAPGARLARYIRNDTAQGLVRHAVADLRQGGQLVLFPEGTRTDGAALNRLRPGFAIIAKRAGAPIQTLFIDTPSPYLCKGWPLWRLPPLPIVFSVRLGRRFEPADDVAALSDEVEAYLRTGVRGSAP
jgi:1-acyl-sn-glycerol-3-phosphate acyltransferase